MSRRQFFLSRVFREYLEEREQLGRRRFAWKIEDSLGDTRHFVQVLEQPLDPPPKIEEILS